MKSLYMKKKQGASDVWRLFAVKHFGQSSLYSSHVTTPATGILRR